MPFGSSDVTLNGPLPTIGQHGLNLVRCAGVSACGAQMCSGTIGTYPVRNRASKRERVIRTVVGLSATTLFMFSV